MQYISVASGSNGNCHFLQKNNTKILVDAGLSQKNICELLAEHDTYLKDINAIFITHEHTDHIKGAGVISRKFDIPIFATEATWENMTSKIGNISEKNTNIISNSDNISVGDLNISSISINHDAKDPVAYKISDGKKTMSIITDLGIVTKKLIDFVKDCSVVVLEANHDINMLEAGPYPYELKEELNQTWDIYLMTVLQTLH